MKTLFRTPLKVLALVGCLLVFLIIINGNSPAFAGSPAAKQVSAPKLAVLVIMDRLKVGDFNDPSLTTFRKLNQEGTWGLLNTATASSRIAVNTYTTISAGVHSIGSSEGSLAFNALEKYENSLAEETFRRRTGRVLSRGEVGHLGLAQLLKGNQDLQWTVQPGAIGTSLHQAGYKTAVLGNADSDLQYHREAVTIAMDNRGIVDMGTVSGRILVSDPTSLVSKRTNYDQIFKEFLELRNKANFIVIELGDSARVDEGALFALDQVVANQRLQALQDADKFLARLSNELDLDKDLLMVVTPTPPSSSFEDKELLTPLLVVGPGFTPGLLTSGTTKRQGIVANTDIAPTVLNYFDVNIPQTMTGRAVSSMAQANPLGYLSQEIQDVVFTYRARPILVQGYVILQIIIIILSVLAIFYRKPSPRVMKHLLLSLAAVPLTLLLLPVLPQPNIFVAVLEALAIAGSLVMISYWLGKSSDLGPFLYISLVTTAIIFIDLLLGSPMMKSSTLGYDPIIGARYYGLGNEYMGIYIGAPIIGLTAFLTYWPASKKAGMAMVALAFLLITYTIAAPNLGTNVGGSISALVAFGLTVFLLLGGKVTKSTFIYGVIGIILLIGLLIVFDLARETASQSHIGRTAASIKTGGLQVVADIISRKMAVNIKLIKYTRWSWVFLLSIGALAMLFYRPIGIFETLRNKYPSLFKGFIGVVVGSITALIFNDSGIVAAATMMIFPVAIMLYLVIEERVQTKHRM